MHEVGDPDRDQLAGTVQLCQHHRVAAIRLDPVARLYRNQRRRHDDAAVPATGQQTVKSISARASFALQDYIHAVEDAEARRDRLTWQIEELLPSWSMALVVAALQAMRGVALVVAVTVVAEVGDFRRFANARQLIAYLGLVPSEHSSGSTIRRGGITKAGNALARRVLIEGAWTYRMTARVSRKLHDRLEPLSAAIRDIAWKAQVRLCARYRRLAASGKPKVVDTAAIAREMVGVIWAIARIAQPALDPD
jgi:transposase